MKKNKLIFRRPQINLFRNTLIIYAVLVFLTYIFNYDDLSTLKESLFVLSGIALPVLLIELLAARTFWRKFTFDGTQRVLYIEHFFLFFNYGERKQIVFKDINITVGLEERNCYIGGARPSGTFWCVYVDNWGQGRPLRDILSKKTPDREYPLGNHLLKRSAEKTKNKIIEFISQHSLGER